MGQTVTTALICGECGEGNYHASSSFYSRYFCLDCGHMMNRTDFVLDDGEVLLARNDVLHVMYYED